MPTSSSRATAAAMETGFKDGLACTIGDPITALVSPQSPIRQQMISIGPLSSSRSRLMFGTPRLDQRART
jgi:hypothetical protein